MSEKELKPMSTKVENLIKGLFLVLISIVMIINVGKVGRTLAFVPLYFFGNCYYFILIFPILFGLHRIIKGKKFKVEHKSIPVGLCFIFVAACVLFCYFSYKSVDERTFNDIKLGELVSAYNGQLDGYYTVSYINLFASPSLWAGGFVGILISGIIANDAIIVFISVILIVIGLFCVFSSYISNAIKMSRGERKEARNAKKELRKAKRVKAEKKKEEVVEEEIPNEPINVVPEVTVSKSLEPEEVRPGYEVDDRPFINENSGFDHFYFSESSNDRSIEKDVPSEYNEFRRLSFEEESPVESSRPTSIPTLEETFTPKEEPVVLPKEEETSLFNEVEEQAEEESPIIEETPIDQELVKIQPQFVEPKPIVEEPVVPTNNELPVRKPRVNWIAPSSEMLAVYETQEARELNQQVADKRTEAINKILEGFSIGAKCTGYTIGPSVTRFNIEYDANVSIRTVEKYEKDISMRLGGVNSRFTPLVEGEIYSGLEIPNATITTVSFKEVFTALPGVKKHPLAVAFGKNISGDIVQADFDEFPHLLVAGTTGSGKSIYTHSIICTLIMRNSPDDLKIVLVDPKKVEMKKYENMPHLLCPIITEADKAKVCLQKLVDEMNNRYELFGKYGSVSNIKQYNELSDEYNVDPLPYILVVIDEYADLVDSCKEISQPVVSIAQKARAAGIHLCISTQRPSTNVITGVIKGNLPTHVALMTSDYQSSITIIGEGGAEKLLGKGDMLVQSPLVSRQGSVRLQGCFVQNKEILHVVDYLKEHYETNYDPNYLDLVDHSNEPATNALAPGEVLKESSEEEEMKYQSIKEWVMSQEYISMSKIQRECSVGFNRAGRFFSRLQKEGVVSSTQESSSKGCKVLVHDDYYDDSNIVTSDELIG